MRKALDRCEQQTHLRTTTLGTGLYFCVQIETSDIMASKVSDELPILAEVHYGFSQLDGGQNLTCANFVASTKKVGVLNYSLYWAKSFATRTHNSGPNNSVTTTSKEMSTKRKNGLSYVIVQ